MNNKEHMHFYMLPLNQDFAFQLYTKKEYKKNDYSFYESIFLELTLGTEHFIPISEEECISFLNFIGNKIIKNDAVIVVASNLDKMFYVATLKGEHLELETMEEFKKVTKTKNTIN